MKTLFTGAEKLIENGARMWCVRLGPSYGCKVYVATERWEHADAALDAAIEIVAEKCPGVFHDASDLHGADTMAFAIVVDGVDEPVIPSHEIVVKECTSALDRVRFLKAAPCNVSVLTSVTREDGLAVGYGAIVGRFERAYLASLYVGHDGEDSRAAFNPLFGHGECLHETGTQEECAVWLTHQMWLEDVSAWR